MASHSSLLTATHQLPVLLVCTPAAMAQRADVDLLLKKAKSILHPNVQIMRINEITHPEVVCSFGFSALPAFVLLQRGLELWRYTGSVDSPEFFYQLGNQMEQTSLKTGNR